MLHIQPKTPMADFTDLTIEDGRLKLLKVIGSGSYGVVYQAVDTASPEHDPEFYAVKCLQKAALDEAQLAYQFREIDLHAKVSGHPNVLTYHRIYEEDTYLFVILDLCLGGDVFDAITLKQMYHRNDYLAKAAVLQLIDAVSSCHDAGVFHRDLKPENVLCGPNGLDIRLADFGLATDRLTSDDFGCGSSVYMSPECLGEEFGRPHYSTRHSDIWSLGIIILNIISGCGLWDFATTKDKRFAAYIHDPDVIRTTHPISKGASEIFKRIFKLNPLSRITLAELREETVKLDTFFMSEEELVAGPEHLRKIAMTYCHHPSSSIVGGRHISSSGETLYGIAEDLDEQYIFHSPDPDVFVTFAPPIISPTHGEPPIEAILLSLRMGNSDTTLRSDSNSSGGSSSSGTESEGPITPETHAANPSIEVPDFAEGEDLDESVVFAKPPFNESTPKAPPAFGFLQAAVQRFRGVRLG